MRILFLSHYFPPEGNAPATRVSALTKRWVAEGHEVTVVTSAPNVPDGVVYDGYKNRVKPQEEEVDGVRVFRVWTYLAPNRGSGRRILNYLSYMVSAVLKVLFLRRPDVIIATSPQFFCGWAGVLSKWWYRVSRIGAARPRFVLEIRDIWPESIGAVDAMSQRSVMVRILEWLEVRMYAAAHCIVTVGEGYRQRLLERGVPEEKMAIVMNGVDRDFLEREIPDPGALRAEWGLKDKFVCSYIGTIGMASGLEIVLRAARILRRRQENRVRFLLVGDGAVRKKLETAARKEGLEEVVFAGRRPKEEVPGFLAASDLCFVHLRKAPLFETVMPSKIFEAMGMGKAILTGVDGEARRLVETSGAGTAMPPEDEEALVDEVLKAMENPKELIERGERGRKHALRHFDLDALAHDYLRVLHALIQRKELPRPEKPF